ncbi:hypothetical protein B0H12DRAFT_1072136 [Mycena haematopus]|nr:hypothetical protein B0H12DRAFT_1072136 [Mycena haematopus]
MNKTALSGSSPGNPWCLDENGELVLQSVKRATAELRHATQRRRAYRGAINTGPPSSIRQDTREEIVARARARAHRDPTFAAQAALRAQAAAEARAEVAAYTKGSRAERILLERDLYLDNLRPPPDVEAKDFHQCCICTGVLSHPVSSLGTGSLELSVAIRSASYVFGCGWNADGLVQTLAADYPTRVDQSRVNYSWDGLVFPTRKMAASTEVNTISAADLRDMDDIERFLRAFEPSLHHLKDAFLDSGFKNAEDLECLCTWPRHNIQDFFANYFTPDEHRRLKKIVIDAFITRLKDKSCECGTCSSMIEPRCVDYKVKLNLSNLAMRMYCNGCIFSQSNLKVLRVQMTDNTEVNNFSVADVAEDMHVIERFLRAFEPSLHELKEPFLSEGIKTAGNLDALCTWPRASVEEYFTNEFFHGWLKAVVVDALVVRFKDKSCVCGNCPSLVEPACVDYKVQVQLK